MRDDTQRQAKYNAKTVAATVGLKVAAELADMKSAFAAACAAFVAKEIAVQGVLNGEGDVPTIQYPFYINYGREIFGLEQRGITGPTQLAMAVSLTVKYESYGLDAATLRKIALDVFTLTIP